MDGKSLHFQEIDLHSLHGSPSQSHLFTRNFRYKHIRVLNSLVGRDCCAQPRQLPAALPTLWCWQGLLISHFLQIFGGVGDGYDLQVYGSFLNMCYAQRLRMMSIMRMMRRRMRMRRIMMTKTFSPSPLNCPSITRNYWLRKLGLQGSKWMISP